MSRYPFVVPRLIEVPGKHSCVFGLSGFAARLAPPNLVSIVVSIELTDQAAKHCTNLNPQKGQPLVNAGEVRPRAQCRRVDLWICPLPGDAGKRVIVELEAEVVRRIFGEYVDGRTPRDIAHDLNRDHVPPPRGRAWNASTINGNMQRGTGLLQNELYAGRLVWNKVRMVKDPDTGKRISRPNPK